MTTNDAAERLWDELLLQACSSDGPIRDADVRQAITIYRPKIEAAERRATVERIRAEIWNGAIHPESLFIVNAILDAEAER